MKLIILMREKKISALHILEFELVKERGCLFVFYVLHRYPLSPFLWHLLVL
jgi:hypothetical protein